MRALILAPFSESALERLRGRMEVSYQSWMDTRRLWSPEELVEHIQRDGVEVLVVEADFIFAEVFAEARSLRFVGVCRGSPENVDVRAASENGVLVVNTPGRNAVAVAELTVGLMIALARRVVAASCLVRSGEWLDPVGPYVELRGMELAGRTTGIVGLGAIGREVACRLRAFDMAILVHDPYIKAGEAQEVGAARVELDRLMSQSDFVTLHCPLTPETAGLIDGRRIALMKPTAYLVNTSASGLCQETALVEALMSRRIAGAAFDVFEAHPLPPQSPLLGLDNVLLTPHLGGATDGTVERYSRMICDDLERFLRRERPLNLLNPEAWASHAA